MIGIVVPFAKSPNVSDRDTYRPITLTSCFAQMLKTMVLNCIRPAVDLQLDSSQAGFRWGVDVRVYASYETYVQTKILVRFTRAAGRSYQRPKVTGDPKQKAQATPPPPHAMRRLQTRGCGGRPRESQADTGVVSTASCAPPHHGKPLAMTSMRRSSGRCTYTLRSRSSTLQEAICTHERQPAQDAAHGYAASRTPGRQPDDRQAHKWWSSGMSAAPWEAASRAACKRAATCSSKARKAHAVLPDQEVGAGLVGQCAG